MQTLALSIRVSNHITQNKMGINKVRIQIKIIYETLMALFSLFKTENKVIDARKKIIKLTAQSHHWVKRCVSIKT